MSMSELLRRIRPTILAILRPTGRPLIDVVFGGAHVDPAVADHGGAVKAGSRTARLRPQRRDLAAALRADTAAPEDELTTWPPAAQSRPCRAC